MNDRISSNQVALGLEILKGVDEALREGHPADVALGRIFKASPSFGARDRRFYASLVYAWYRWRGWTDPQGKANAAGVLGALLQEHDQLNDHLLELAHIADVAPDRLVPAANLDWQDRAAAVARLCNGAEPPTLEQLAPQWVAGQLAFKGEERDAWYRSLQSRPPVWLRMNPSQIEKSVSFLNEQGVPCLRHPHLPGALRVDKPLPSGWLHRPPLNRAEIQDIASQTVGLVCSPAPQEKWWDACAGSGGKTLQLAEVLGRQGSLTASDVRPAILDQLRRRLRRKGIKAVTVNNADAAEARQKDVYDGVLVDAPCSGSGTWARNPDARWRRQQKDVLKFHHRQLQILEGAASALKTGGRLVYAVCSTFKAETEDVSRAFRDNNPGFVPASFIHPLTSETCDGDAWCKPWAHDCTGMYIAVFTKTATSAANES